MYAFLASFIWYFFDDYLAQHFGVPAIGTLDWPIVLGVCAMISFASYEGNSK